MKLDSQTVRTMLLDKQTTLEMVDELLINTFENTAHWKSEDPKIRECFRVLSEKVLKDAVEKIFRFSESKIETIFLNSVLFFSFMRSPLFFRFTARYPSISKTLKNMRSIDSENAYLQKLFEKKTGISNPMEFVRVFENTPGVSEEEKLRRSNLFFGWRMLGFRDKYHVSMQSGVEEITINGKHIRPDILIWIPSIPSFKLIVECDGYAFHSDKFSFTRDRARDRLLRSHDYDVLRFSGLEIYHQPEETAMELMIYLDDKYKKLFPGEASAS